MNPFNQVVTTTGSNHLSLYPDITGVVSFAIEDFKDNGHVNCMEIE